MKFKVKDGVTYYIKSKPSDFVIEMVAHDEGMSIKEYLKWAKTTPGYSNLKKYWQGLDK